MIRPYLFVAAMLLGTGAGAWTTPDYATLQAAQQSRDDTRKLQQRERLQTARDQLGAAKKRVGSDDSRFRSLQTELAQLTTTRDRRLTSLGEQQAAVRDLFTTARQTAGDLITLVRNSPTRPPQPELEQELVALATSTRALDLDALASLWEALHVTLTDTATQSRLQLDVQTAPGVVAAQEVTRIGTVMAVAGDRQVVYDRVASLYRALPAAGRQHRALAVALATGKDVVEVPFEPVAASGVYRDAVLESLSESGPVGALIVALGVLGLVVLVLRTLLVQRIIRNEKLAGVNSAGIRLRQQLDSHRTESSVSLAGWLNTCVRQERRRTRWGHTVLSLIIGVAPLLGLLGTITGMIVTFHSLRLYGGGDPVLMADGVAQALSTTLLGLSVAIPLLIGQRWLLARANRHIHRLNTQVLAFIAMRERS